jgi:hypothetical protein
MPLGLKLRSAAAKLRSNIVGTGDSEYLNTTRVRMIVDFCGRTRRFEPLIRTRDSDSVYESQPKLVKKALKT